MSRKRFPGNLTYIEHYAYEVQWYRVHGKHPDRIGTDELGHKYVMSDLLWNNRHPSRTEHIKFALADYIAERVTGIKK